MQINGYPSVGQRVKVIVKGRKPKEYIGIILPSEKNQRKPDVFTARSGAVLVRILLDNKTRKAVPWTSDTSKVEFHTAYFFCLACLTKPLAFAIMRMKNAKKEVRAMPRIRTIGQAAREGNVGQYRWNPAGWREDDQERDFCVFTSNEGEEYTFDGYVDANEALVYALIEKGGD